MTAPTLWLLVVWAVLVSAPVAIGQQIPRCASDAAFPPKSGCLQVDYDRFKDSTLAALQFTVVERGTDRRVLFMLMSTYASDNPAGKDRTYALAVASVGTKVEPSRLARQIDVLIDGNSRSTMTLIVTKTSTNPSGVSSEQLLAVMSADDITL